jgi:HPt (histidine-containing phosphotransfer) domain-containing protein
MSLTHFPEQNFDSIPSLDISVLHSFDDPEMSADLVTELIEIYLIETSRLVDLMESDLTSAEWSSVKRTAHTIKGSSGNLGLLRMARLSEELEYGAHTRDTASVLVEQMKQEFAAVSQTLNAELKRRKQCAF